MLLIEIAQLTEMARPAKICKKCGKSMAGHHYWYKGGWVCKKANRKTEEPAEKKSEPKKEPKKEEPAKRPQDDDEDEKEHKGAVKGLEREAGEEVDPDVKAAEKAEKDTKKKTKPGETISAAETREIDAESEGAARKQINSLFPKASPEQKARALNVWKARQKKRS